MSIPRWIHRGVPNLLQIGPAFWQLPKTFEFVTPYLPPPPPDMPPGVLRGDLHLAYTHSQMNPQMWTKVGGNRSSRLTYFPDLWLFDPIKPSKCPPCVSRGNLFGVYTKLVPIGPAVWIFPWFFNLWPPNPPPPMSRGELYLAYVHSQTNLQTCTKFGANRSSRLTASQTFGFVTP